MENFFDTNNKKDCNGCGTCTLKCPKNAIKMIEDEEGFLYPRINKEKCINCGICKKICSNNPKTNKFKSKVYIAKNKSETERMESTSGGMFRILAKHVLSLNGVVFGAKFDKNLNVVHDFADTIEGVKEFCNSKYVRSSLQTRYIYIYIQVREFLKQNKMVLFTGTPCQNYGLKKFLGKEYDNLILCEIICHSNPSPKVWELYKKNIEIESNKKVINYYFRNKSGIENNRPYAVFEGNSTKQYQGYNGLFSSMVISRPSCSHCKFADTNRKADITIGDFWGAKKIFPDFYDEKGISLLSINSEKGMKVFNEIKKDISFKESNLAEAFKENHNKSLKESIFRKYFFKNIKRGKINERNIIRKAEQINFCIKIQNKLFRKVE